MALYKSHHMKFYLIITKPKDCCAYSALRCGLVCLLFLRTRGFVTLAVSAESLVFVAALVARGFLGADFFAAGLFATVVDVFVCEGAVSHCHRFNCSRFTQGFFV